MSRLAPTLSARRPDAKIPFHHKLADLLVDLVDLTLAGGLVGFRMAWWTLCCAAS